MGKAPALVVFVAATVLVVGAALTVAASATVVGNLLKNVAAATAAATGSWAHLWRVPLF